MSAHPDPIDQRWRYETEDSIKDKLRKLKLYQTRTDKIKLRKPGSSEEAEWRYIVDKVVKRLNELKE
jgi:hypothetical protein